MIKESKMGITCSYRSKTPVQKFVPPSEHNRNKINSPRSFPSQMPRPAFETRRNVQIPTHRPKPIERTLRRTTSSPPSNPIRIQEHNDDLTTGLIFATLIGLSLNEETTDHTDHTDHHHHHSHHDSNWGGGSSYDHGSSHHHDGGGGGSSYDGGGGGGSYDGGGGGGGGGDW